MLKALKIGSRKSPLAMAQAHLVCEEIKIANANLREEGSIEIVEISTSGDEIQDRALIEAGGKGLFTKEIEDCLLDGRIDIAVHSMKDMPTQLPDGLEISCVLEREDPRDVFFSPIANTIDDLPKGASLGTASLRRQAIALNLRPDLKIELIRGNVGTRLQKLKDGIVDATFLAAAGMNRLGLSDKIQTLLEPEIMLPAVGQGIIGIESRIGDKITKEIIEPFHHKDTFFCMTAERSFLETLDGSCRTPIGALAQFEENTDMMELNVLIARPDGTDMRREKVSGIVTEPDDAYELGKRIGIVIKKDLPENFFEVIE